MPISYTVLLLACAECGVEWLDVQWLVPKDHPHRQDTQAMVTCPLCLGQTGQACAVLPAGPWWELLGGRLLPIDTPDEFLIALAWYVTRDHPAGPVGAKALTPGMQLVQTTAPNGDTTWSWSRAAGSEN